VNYVYSSILFQIYVAANNSYCQMQARPHILNAFSYSDDQVRSWSRTSAQFVRSESYSRSHSMRSSLSFSNEFE
jgi:hypothetical protein